ncbi:hypothetical protein K440DRAFT_639419 [Wilcoxina mikolae CBS 423.85]|nr:hypothetical protein K440DRAFT_639419 [Wilcoxina mikolae CBS 423.85]
MLNGIASVIFADSGSESNFMTISYVTQNNISINKSPEYHRTLPFANGKFFRVIGKATAKWMFHDDPTPRDVDFEVVTKCIHSVMFGNPFLQKTKSFLQKYKHRLVDMGRSLKKNIRYVNSIGSVTQYLPVLATGKNHTMRLEALPDTGAEGNVISELCFRRSGLRLEQSEVAFMFPDGSIEESLGRVRLRVSFEDEPIKSTYTYVEVMRGCQQDAILGHDFVFDNKVYSDNMHRLVETAAEIGLNLVIFVEKPEPEVQVPNHRLAASHRNHALTLADRAVRQTSAQANGPPPGSQTIMSVNVQMPHSAAQQNGQTQNNSTSASNFKSAMGGTLPLQTVRGQTTLRQAKWRRFWKAFK